MVTSNFLVFYRYNCDKRIYIYIIHITKNDTEHIDTETI